MALHEGEHLVVAGHFHPRERPEETEDLGSTIQAAARDFTDHERMAADGALLEEGRKPGVGPPQVLHPYRGIDQSHEAFLGRRRRAA